MRRPTALLAWGALSSPAAAWLKNPWLKSAAEESWKPPVETGAAHQDQLALGWSPRPTEAPALYARMDLVERMDDYTLGADTCGFVANGNSFTCITAGETCSFSSGYIGCCSTDECDVVRTTCIDYDASSAGRCDLPDDFHTICCGTSSIGSCLTYILSTTGSDSDPDSTFTLLGCGSVAGTSTLFDYDPAWARTHSFASDSTTASESDESSTSGSETESSAPATTTADDDDDDDSGPPIGAIAGGAVGGVALIALVGLAVFFILRKKRAKKQQQPPPAPPPASGAAVAPPMSQQQQPPISPQSPQSFAPSSPSGTLYPSGVPPNFQGYPPQQGSPQPYDPRISAYGQQGYPPQQGYDGQGYAPPQQGYPPQNFQPQGFQQQQQGFQQQGQYNQYGAAPGYAPPSSASPPPNMTPSPAPKESEPVHGGQQQHQNHQSPPQDAQELPAIHPVGNEGNRAELG